MFRAVTTAVYADMKSRGMSPRWEMVPPLYMLRLAQL